MKRIKLTALLTAAFYAVFSFSQALAAFSFQDTRFQNVLTTENLDAIIEEYELYDGWYWTISPRPFTAILNVPAGPQR